MLLFPGLLVPTVPEFNIPSVNFLVKKANTATIEWPNQRF